MFCCIAKCDRSGGDSEVQTGGFSSSGSDDYDDDIQLDDTAGPHNERRDVARSDTTTRTSLKQILSRTESVAPAPCRLSTELICFTVLILTSFMSLSTRTYLQFVSVQTDA